MFITKKININSIDNQYLDIIFSVINNLNKTIMHDIEIVVAGGFARELFNYTNNKESNSIEYYLFKLHGDVDVFFLNHMFQYNILKFANDTSKFLTVNYSNKDCVKYQINNYTSLMSNNVEFIENQYIDKKTIKFQHIQSFYNKDFELLNDFDFVNSMYSFKIIEDEIVFKIREDALAFDKLRILEINRAVNNLLCYRINKYLNTKNLDKLSDKSIDVIKNYITDIAFDNISIFSGKREHLLNSKNNSEIMVTDIVKMQCLSILRRLGLLNDKQATLFIGKWLISKFEKDKNQTYAFLEKKVDWAIDKIRS